MRTFSRVTTATVLASFLLAQVAPVAAFARTYQPQSFSPATLRQRMASVLSLGSAVGASAGQGSARTASVAPPAPVVGLGDIQQLTKQNAKLATALANGVSAELGEMFGTILPGIASGLELAATHVSGLSRELNTAFNQEVTQQAKTVLGAGLGQAVNNFGLLRFGDGVTPGTSKAAPKSTKPALQPALPYAPLGSAGLVLVAHAEESGADVGGPLTIEVPIDIGTTATIPVPMGLPSRMLDYLKELELRMNKKLGAAIVSTAEDNKANPALLTKLMATYKLWQLLYKTKNDLLNCPYDPKGTSRALKQWAIENFVTPELQRFRSRLETDLDILNADWVRRGHFGGPKQFREEQSYHEDKKDSTGKFRGSAYRNKAGRLVEGAQIVGNDIDQAVEGRGQLFTYSELLAVYMLEDAVEDFVNNCTTNATNLYNDTIAKVIKHLLQSGLLGKDKDKQQLIVEQINKKLPEHIDTNIDTLLAALDGLLENLRSILGAAEAFHTKKDFQDDLAKLGKALDRVVALTPGDCCASQENPAVTLAKTKAGAEIKACHEPGTTATNVEGILKELLVNLLKDQLNNMSVTDGNEWYPNPTLVDNLVGEHRNVNISAAKFAQEIGSRYFITEYNLVRNQQTKTYKTIDPYDSVLEAAGKAGAKLALLLGLAALADMIEQQGCQFDPATGQYKYSLTQLMDKALADLPALLAAALPKTGSSDVDAILKFLSYTKLISVINDVVNNPGTVDDPGPKVFLDNFKAIAQAIDDALQALRALAQNNSGQLQAMQSAMLSINELVNKMSLVGAELQSQINRSGRTGSAADAQTRMDLEDQAKNGRFKSYRDVAAKKLREMDQDEQRKRANEEAAKAAAKLEKQIVEDAAEEVSGEAQNDIQAAQCQKAKNQAAALTAEHNAQEQRARDAAEAAKLGGINQLQNELKRLDDELSRVFRKLSEAGKSEDTQRRTALDAQRAKLNKQIAEVQQKLNGLLNKK